MKVRELIKILLEKNLDDDVCSLIWFKSDFDYAEDDEVILTDEAWSKIVNEFDRWPESSLMAHQWIADAVIEYCELRPEHAASQKSIYAQAMGLCEEAVDNW